MPKRTSPTLDIRLSRTALLAAVVAAFAQLPNGQGAPAGTSARPRPEASLSCEPNHGQAPAAAAAICRKLAVKAFLKPDGVLFLTPGSDPIDPPAPFQLSFVGADSAARSGQPKEPTGRANYFRGADPKRWLRAVPLYRDWTWKSVYPGIDIVYHDRRGSLEIDFVLAPGSDPAAIRFEAARQYTLDLREDGTLIVEDPRARQLVLEKPRAYQLREGDEISVPSEYRVQPNGEISFAIGAYDPSLPLTIDPVVTYSSYLGGSRHELAEDVVLNEGRMFIVGTTYSTDFPTVAPLFTRPTPQFAFLAVDVFLMRIDPETGTVEAATYFGGAGTDVAGGLAAVDDGILITGTTGSTDLPLMQPLQTSLAGGRDAFLAKLSSDLSSLTWSTYLGGSALEQGLGVAADASGQPVVVGSTTSTDYPVSDELQSENAGSSDVFVSKLQSDGSGFVFSSYLGGEGADTAYGVALNGTDAVFIAGSTTSAALPAASSAQPDFGGIRDGFAAKLRSDGQALQYLTYLGGGQIDEALGIDVGRTNIATVSGKTCSSDFPVEQPFQPALAGACDAFVTQLNPGGDGFLYSSYLGGALNDGAFDVDIDDNGNAFLTGSTDSPDFPLLLAQGSGATPSGGVDAFVTAVDPVGVGLLYSARIGGSGSDSGRGIVAADDGSVVLAGRTTSIDYPVVSPAQPNLAGGLDGFAMVLSSPFEAPPSGGSDPVFGSLSPPPTGLFSYRGVINHYEVAFFPLRKRFRGRVEYTWNISASHDRVGGSASAQLGFSLVPMGQLRGDLDGFKLNFTTRGACLFGCPCIGSAVFFGGGTIVGQCYRDNFNNGARLWRDAFEFTLRRQTP